MSPRFAPADLLNILVLVFHRCDRREPRRARHLGYALIRPLGGERISRIGPHARPVQLPGTCKRPLDAALQPPHHPRAHRPPDVRQEGSDALGGLMWVERIALSDHLRRPRAPPNREVASEVSLSSSSVMTTQQHRIAPSDVYSDVRHHVRAAQRVATPWSRPGFINAGQERTARPDMMVSTLNGHVRLVSVSDLVRPTCEGGKASHGCTANIPFSRCTIRSLDLRGL